MVQLASPIKCVCQLHPMRLVTHALENSLENSCLMPPQLHQMQQTHLVQLADTLDRGDGERHILVARILVLVFLIYSCTTCANTNTPDTVMAGAKLADLEMQEKKTKTLRKTVQQKNKYTRKTGKTAGESRKKKNRKRKTKTANKSLSTEAMERSRRVGGAARKAVEDVSHAWRC